MHTVGVNKKFTFHIHTTSVVRYAFHRLVLRYVFVQPEKKEWRISLFTILSQSVITYLNFHCNKKQIHMSQSNISRFVLRSVVKMVFNRYIRQRILHHYFEGHKAPTIAKLLQEEGLEASCVGISQFLIKFRETGSIGRS